VRLYNVCTMLSTITFCVRLSLEVLVLILMIDKIKLRRMCTLYFSVYEELFSQEANI